MDRMQFKHGIDIPPLPRESIRFAEGRIQQFVRSEFNESPTRDWEVQWGMLEKVAVNLLAGMPAVVKPSEMTSFLTEATGREGRI